MDSMRNQIANTINALYSLMQKLDETTAHAQATIAAVQAAAATAAANGYNPDYGGDYGGRGGNNDSGNNNRNNNSGPTNLVGTYDNTRKGQSPLTKNGGCFAPGTKIIMSDLSIKNIENIQIGDKVIAYNDETGLYEPRTVIKSYAHYNTPAMIKVILSNGIIMNMTPGHPLLSING